MTLGEKIYKLRTKRSMTQEQLSGYRKIKIIGGDF